MYNTQKTSLFLIKVLSWIQRFFSAIKRGSRKETLISACVLMSVPSSVSSLWLAKLVCLGWCAQLLHHNLCGSFPTLKHNTTRTHARTRVLDRRVPVLEGTHKMTLPTLGDC